MKKVSGYIRGRALGRYDFVFYVEDDTTDEEIEQRVNDVCEYSISYDVEGGYEAVKEIVYRKKNER